MKIKSLLFMLVLLSYVSMAQEKGKFTLEGKVGSIVPQKVYVAYYDLAVGELVSDTAIVSNGKYLLKLNMGQNVARGFLLFDYTGKGLPKGSLVGRDYLVLMIGREAIKVTTADSIKHGVITDSRLNDEYKSLFGPISDIMNKRIALVNEYNKTPEHLRDNTIYKKMEELEKEEKELAKQFIATHPSSPISLEAFSVLLTNNWKVEEVIPIFEGLDQSLRNSVKGQMFSKQLYK